MRCPFSLAYHPIGVFFGRTTDYNFHLALVPRRNSAREVGGPSVARVISVGGKCVCNIIFAGRRYSAIDNTCRSSSVRAKFGFVEVGSGLGSFALHPLELLGFFVPAPTIVTPLERKVGKSSDGIIRRNFADVN